MLYTNKIKGFDQLSDENKKTVIDYLSSLSNINFDNVEVFLAHEDSEFIEAIKVLKDEVLGTWGNGLVIPKTKHYYYIKHKYIYKLNADGCKEDFFIYKDHEKDKYVGLEYIKGDFIYVKHSGLEENAYMALPASDSPSWFYSSVRYFDKYK